MTNEESEKRKKDLREAMEKARGYMPSAWAYVLDKDLDFMEAYDNLYNCALMEGKALPIKTKELIAIALLAFRGNENGVHDHMKRALKHGANKMEILEALETAIIPGGAPTFGTGLRALMRIEKEEEKS